MKIELTTELLPLLDVGMYNSFLSPDELFSNDYEDMKSENKEETDFDMSKYEADVCKIANKIIQEEFSDTLKKYGVDSIKCVSIGSPKYYNYQNDWGNLDLEVCDDFFMIMESWLQGKCLISGWREGADRWMRDTYGSCSGFISFMPTTVQELLEHDDVERCVAVYLSLVLWDEGLFYFDVELDVSVAQYSFYERVQESLLYDDYATTESIYDPELWDMFLRFPDKLNELIWELFDKGVIRYSEIVRNVRNERETEMERFLRWTRDNQYSYEDLVALMAKN